MVTLTRGVPSTMMAALQGTFYPVLFVHLDWPGDPVRAHSGVGTLTWGGHDWTGVGDFGDVSVPAEACGSMVATEATVSIIASAEALDAFADDAIRNRPGAIYMGCLTTRPGDGGDLVSVPVEVFAGTMDRSVLTFEPSDGGGVSGRLTVTLLTGPSARSLAAVSHSDADQRRKYPADTAGHMVVLAEPRAKVLTWPES